VTARQPARWQVSTASIVVTMKSIVSSVVQVSFGSWSFQNGLVGKSAGFSSRPASGVPIDSGPSACGSRSAVSRSIATSLSLLSRATSSNDGTSAARSESWSSTAGALAPASRSASAASTDGSSLCLDFLIGWRSVWASGTPVIGPIHLPNCARNRGALVQ
jgi:hypothetical protein